MANKKNRKKRHKSGSNGRFPIGEFSIKRKEYKDHLLSANKYLAKEAKKLKRINEKVEKVQRSVNEAKQKKAEVLKDISNIAHQHNQPVVQVLKQTSEARKKIPSSLNENGKLQLPRRSATRRQKETLEAAKAIHGSSSSNDKLPALDGMFATLTSYSSRRDLEVYASKSQRMRDAALINIKKECKTFSESNDNLMRSLGVLYSSGIASKRKYNKIRSSLTMKNTGNLTKKGMQGRSHILLAKSIPIPPIMTYKSLQDKINQINIGTLHDVKQDFCTELSDEAKVDGRYRDLEEMLLVMAEFYLSINSKQLEWFGKPMTFLVAIGGDGAPLGKWDQCIIWLLSFLNIGAQITSPYHNHLLFAANCSETHHAVELYTKRIGKQIGDIERKEYTVLENKVKFQFELVPADMKFIAFINGELSNSATYFSSFGNVSLDDKDDLSGSLGTSNCKWHPWDYEKRVSDAGKVAKFKKEVEKLKVASSTKRLRVTTFIKGLKSRQEFPPFIGKDLCGKELVDPLHLKNNSVQKYHSLLLDQALKRTPQVADCTSTAEVPKSSVFARYMNALRNDVGAGRLYKQISKWFSDDRLKKKDFSYRFTGKDSRLLLHGFSYLITSLYQGNENESSFLRLVILTFVGVRLRTAVSLFSKYNFSSDDLQLLEAACKEYYVIHSLMLEVSCTAWTVGLVIPVHAKIALEKYGKGLGITSTQGREAKHVFIKSYLSNSTYAGRWEQVFKHEFISNIHLPKMHGSHMYHGTTESVVPKRVQGDDKFCFCGNTKLPDASGCFICVHPLMGEVIRSVEQKGNTPKIKQLLS